MCDPMWHVSSRSGVATLRTAIHLLLTYLLTLTSLHSLGVSGQYQLTAVQRAPELSVWQASMLCVIIADKLHMHIYVACKTHLIMAPVDEHTMTSSLKL